MNRNHFWKFIFIVFVVVWSIYEMYPPRSRNLIEHFQTRTARPTRDLTLSNIVEQAKALQKERPDRDYENLRDAIGTNDITRYFPFFEAKEQLEPTTYVLNRLQREAAGKVRLGLDLQGGTSLLVRMDTNQLQNAERTDDAIAQAVEVLRKRVDNLGVAEPVIQPQGKDRILIQLPGLSESAMADAKTQIQKVAYLEFRLVHPQSDSLASRGITEPGYEILKEVRKLKGGEKQIFPYLVKRRPELVGGIQRAIVIRGNLGEPKIAFTFDDRAADVFAKVTRENVGRQLAIVLDGDLQSAPRINEAIEGGNGEISGSYTEQEAFQLANVLENPLEAPLSIEEERTVDPSLGKDSIKSGMVASLIAAVSTVVFMLIFYFASGLVANIALLLNILILFGAMCSIGATLTMPGIAGIALTIGMAVDANVLIYERMREEMAAGKSIRGVIAASYQKAFGTIFDSNLTTFIAAIILVYRGTGPIKGFGVTLAIGICVNIFTAVVGTRLIYDLLLAKGWLNRIRMLPLAKFPQFAFMKWGKLACVASIIMILFGVGNGLYHGHKVLGVDFAGGESLRFAFSQRVGEDQLRAALEQAGLGDASIGYQENLSTGLETLQVVVPIGAAGKADTALKEKFPQSGFNVLATDRVGATVGEEIQRSAVIASLLAMFMILIYVAFRYEFSFAIASVIALLHDVLITLGIYFLSGRQLTAPMVAAILTIIGYSINDKIVIMDRIREDLRLGVRGSFRELIDIALNQTLSRTIITGGAVILATLALLLFGGGVINDFAFTFLVGIISGTYSSLFIAAPIVLWLNKGERPKIGASQVAVEATQSARG